jgi:BMFP domain-containing protein YqiC
MFDPKVFDDLAKKLSDAVPPSLKQVKDDMEKNFRAILQSAFAKLDLVTREEFDIQVAVLAKTREKLEALDVKLQQFESKSNRKPKETTTK